MKSCHGPEASAGQMIYDEHRYKNEKKKEIAINRHSIKGKVH